MTPIKVKLECENCGSSIIVTYDTDVPARLLAINCYCGHVTPIQQTPAPETVALQMPPDPGPDPTKLEYDDWIARTRECPACHGQGCEGHETDDGRLVCGPHCERCEQE